VRGCNKDSWGVGEGKLPRVLGNGSGFGEDY